MTTQAPMGPEMQDELLRALAPFKHSGPTVEVERVSVDRQGYGPGGRYFGSLGPGERMHRVDLASDFDQTTVYVRATCTARRLKAIITSYFMIEAVNAAKGL